MRRLWIGVASIALVTGLAACSTAQEQQTATSISDVCAAGAPLIAQAQTKAPAPTSAAGIELAYAESACTTSGQVAASLPSTTDPAWVEDVLQGLQIAAELEPVLLPVLSAL